MAILVFLSSILTSKTLSSLALPQEDLFGASDAFAGCYIKLAAVVRASCYTALQFPFGKFPACRVHTLLMAYSLPSVLAGQTALPPTGRPNAGETRRVIQGR